MRDGDVRMRGYSHRVQRRVREHANGGDELRRVWRPVWSWQGLFQWLVQCELRQPVALRRWLRGSDERLAQLRCVREDLLTRHELRRRHLRLRRGARYLQRRVYQLEQRSYPLRDMRDGVSSRTDL